MKTKKWTGWLLGWMLLLLALGAALCTVLYQYLSVYEISRPEPEMDELMATMSHDDWYEAIRGDFTGDLSEFEQPQTLLEQFYKGSLRDAEFSYRKDTGLSDDDRAVFVVRAGHVNFARVTLTAAEDGQLRFGRHLWQVESIEPDDILSGLHALRVEIDAAPEQQIYVNGVLLGPDYLVDTALPCPNLTPLEQRMEHPPTLYRYRIDRMYGEISVTTGEGTMLPPTVEGSAVRYFAAGETLHRLELFAPEDVQVSVCGAVLLEEEAASRSLGILENLETFTKGDAYETLHYVLEGLYSEPVIQARDKNGTELEPVVTEAGTLHYFHANDEKYARNAIAYPKDFFEAYTRYSTRAYTDRNQMLLLSRIWPNSDLYRYILNSKDTMIWAVTTTVNRFDDLEFTDFYRLNDSCFVCTVRYKANMTTNAKQGTYSYDEENIAELCFVRNNDKYYCAAMSFITD